MYTVTVTVCRLMEKQPGCYMPCPESGYSIQLCLTDENGSIKWYSEKVRTDHNGKATFEFQDWKHGFLFMDIVQHKFRSRVLCFDGPSTEIHITLCTCKREDLGGVLTQAAY